MTHHHDPDPTPPHGTPRPSPEVLAEMRLNIRRSSLALSLRDLAEWAGALAAEVVRLTPDDARAWLDDLNNDDPFGAVRFDLEHIADIGTEYDDLDDTPSPFGNALDR